MREAVDLPLYGTRVVDTADDRGELCGEILDLSVGEIEDLMSRGVLDAPAPEATG